MAERVINTKASEVSQDVLDTLPAKRAAVMNYPSMVSESGLRGFDKEGAGSPIDISMLVAEKMGKSVVFRAPWKDQFRKWGISECTKVSIPKNINPTHDN